MTADIPCSDPFPCWASFATLPRALLSLNLKACIKSQREDFQVDEELGYAPAGRGDHVWLRLRKDNANTEWVARRLAQIAGVRQVDVGFAGLKDRQAVTTQWFSIHLAGQAEPDWSSLATEGMEPIEVVRHPRKLRRGAFARNRFTIWLRHLSDHAAPLAERLQQIDDLGVPNYFGPQRFGRAGANLRRAYAMIMQAQPVRNRHKRGLYLSAARALLFNRVLAQRVRSGSWNLALPGDLMMLEGTHSFFPMAGIEETICDRVVAKDLHPTGPLWGRYDNAARTAVQVLEESVLQPCAAWCKGLESAGLRQQRRALRLTVGALDGRCDGSGTFCLTFSLPPGGFATAVLRELVDPR